MKNIVENQYIKIDNSDFSFLTNQKPWLKIPADGSPLTFTGNADEAAKEFFNALIRVRDGYISALKAERDAQQKRADALAVESKTLSDALSLISRCYKHSPHIQSMCVVETPATDAALAAIQAQGVEKAAAALDALSAQSASATTQGNFRAAAVYLRTTVLPAIGEAK
ncbi:hypothetical protein BVG90_15165 [Serratia marcescens]|uniref:hypothetical protein n=1 Tax=Serratia marcescens TaxID=615 RepID=UPI000B5F74FE|nr:hypothetical protein [Serratia marcescens]ASM17986.1 hypothetical protein BVG90_15165 [Serratia marcescens]